MEQIVIRAESRNIKGKQVKALRREGGLPAILYGRGIVPIPVTLDYLDAHRVLGSLTSSHLILIDVEGVQHNALVRDKQRHPVRGTLEHVDFLVVSMTEKLRAEVMLELVGESPAAQNYNAVIVTGIESVEVESMPQDLPERITVDISSLQEIGDQITVRDLILPPAIELLADPEEMVALATYVAGPEEEKEAEAELEEGEPEVIEKGKKMEDEEK